MKRKVHVIPHSHWDREWYFNTSRSKVYLMKDLKDVLDTLESNQDFQYFMLDAQGSLLDDYIKWVPEDAERIKKLVQDKRLIIGPWYTQTDQLVISAESIVRNMYYGMKRCEDFGGYMNVGYVPDSFGQSGNMPQIYREFGIEDTLFWRGVSDDMVEHTDFNWRGDDGSIVFTTQIPFGYYIGGNIPEDANQSENFWQKECFEKAGKRSATRHIYFPNGFDQAPIRKNIPDIIKQRNEKDPNNEYVISCVEDYIKDVKSEHPELEEVAGELVIAKHMRIHKSIFSSRSDLKVLNTQVQNYVTNVLEPLLTLSYQLGNDYPHGPVADIWKLLFENAAHDSIGSCISDNANEDVYVRYKQAKDIALNLVELHSRLIATKIKSTKDVTLTLLNTLPQTRNDVVVFETYLPSDCFTLRDENNELVDYTIIEKQDLTQYVLSQTIQLNPSKKIFIPNKVYRALIAIDAKNVPALGYVQYGFDLTEENEQELQSLSCLENEYYKITINQNGSLDIFDKATNYTYTNQAVLVENGDDGDSFNYSPPREDLEVFSTESEFHYTINGSNLYQQAKINYTMVIPADLEKRAQKEVGVNLPITLEVGLRKGSKTIDFNVIVDNKGLSHRLCVLFDSHLVTKFNYADQQFGSIKRPNVYEKEMALYLKGLGNQKEVDTSKVIQLANWANDQSTWQEPPISIEPTQSYVSLTDGTRGIAIMPQGVREYEVIGEDGNTIRLTLFRTYGFMGKENLVYRPGRASGEKIIETKDAQLLKQMNFQFGFTTYTGNINDANIDLLAKEYNTPIQVYEYADFLNGRLIFAQEDVEQTLANKKSFFETKGQLVVSAIKKCENRKGYIIRLYNGKDHKELGDQIIFHTNISKAYYTNLKEENMEEIKVNDNTITIRPISHCKFVTLYVE